MKTVRFKLDSAVQQMSAGRVKVRKLEGTSEADLKAQQKIDDAAAAHDAAQFAQRVRKRLGLTQLEFSRRIASVVETITWVVLPSTAQDATKQRSMGRWTGRGLAVFLQPLTVVSSITHTGDRAQGTGSAPGQAMIQLKLVHHVFATPIQHPGKPGRG